MEIERVLTSQLYYLALISTLTLPDNSWLTASDCYGLRCGVTHQGIIKTDTRRQPSDVVARVGAWAVAEVDNPIVKANAARDITPKV